MDTLPTSLKVLLTTSAGMVAIWLSIRAMNLIKRPEWSENRCVYTGMTVAGVIGIVIWVAGGAMGYNTFPATTGDWWWRGWVETIMGVGLTVAVLAKGYYDGVYHPLDKKSKGV
jgi:hypothetical protein